MTRAEANRLNAQKSTGPRTEAGKDRASRNAVKHGLTARHLVLSCEERDDFEHLRAELYREHAPQSTQEVLLVTQIADSFYRLQRARKMETDLFERELSDSATADMSVLAVFEKKSGTFELLRRYTASLERSYYRAIAELRRTQNDRRRFEREIHLNLREGRDRAAAQAEQNTAAPPEVGFVSQSRSSAPKPPSSGSVKDAVNQ
jgi:hypothetical protein